MYIELFIFIYSLFFVLIPLAIFSTNRHSGWKLMLILFVSMLILPAICLWAISGLTFGNYENIGLVIFCLFLPSSLVLIIDDEKVK